MRSWQRTVVAPSRPPPERIDEPTNSLRLSWVYGFRAYDSKNGVKYTNTGPCAPQVFPTCDFFFNQHVLLCFNFELHSIFTLFVPVLLYHPSPPFFPLFFSFLPPLTPVPFASVLGEVLFFAGSACVNLDLRTRTQTFFLEHKDEVLSLAVHPKRALAASGEQARVPSILVWDYEAKTTVATLTGLHRRGVSHLCFSPDGKWLASVGLDDFHTLVVHEWAMQTVRCVRPTLKVSSFLATFPSVCVFISRGRGGYWRMCNKDCAGAACCGPMLNCSPTWKLRCC